MALSATVKESVDTASSALREAIAFAARGEQTVVINVLADILSRLESIEAVDNIVERMTKKELPDNFRIM